MEVGGEVCLCLKNKLLVVIPSPFTINEGKST